MLTGKGRGSLFMAEFGRSDGLREEYVSRINRVIDYIEEHIEDEHSLNRLAKVASFSPYHFHRIFKGIVGEPLNRFIQRIRLEKAANRLIENPKLSVTEVALECGFSGSSSFARAFREHFGTSATGWREEKSKNGETERNIGKTNSNVRKDGRTFCWYAGGTESQENRRIEMAKKENLRVDVMDVPAVHVAYVRHIGPYKGDEALFERLFNKLFRWAGARDLLNFPETKVLTVYHDNPEVTDESRLRTSVCISVPEKTAVDGDVGKMTIAGGKYAVGHFELSGDEYEAAWNSLYGTWLPESGYQPDDRPTFEMYLNDPKEHPENKAVVDIYMPVKPL
jgi:AraC family transcriptional regulator